MNCYGIKGPLIKWFENYLHQRKQKVINTFSISTTFWLEYPKEVSSAKSY
jgi:hypothetical protein